MQHKDVTFDADGFLQFLYRTFNCFEYPIPRDMADNIVRYAMSEYLPAEEAFVNHLMSMIPQITEQEIKNYLKED